MKVSINSPPPVWLTPSGIATGAILGLLLNFKVISMQTVLVILGVFFVGAVAFTVLLFVKLLLYCRKTLKGLRERP